MEAIVVESSTEISETGDVIFSAPARILGDVIAYGSTAYFFYHGRNKCSL
jgi:hypothetical protein